MQEYRRFQDFRVGNVQIEHIAEAMRIALREADLTYRLGLGFGCSDVLVEHDEHGDHAVVTFCGTAYRVTLANNQHGLREITFRRYDRTVSPFAKYRPFPIATLVCPRPIDAVRAVMDTVSHDRNTMVLDAVLVCLEARCAATA